MTEYVLISILSVLPTLYHPSFAERAMSYLGRPQTVSFIGKDVEFCKKFLLQTRKKRWYLRPIRAKMK